MRDGGVIPGTAARANEVGIVVRTQFGGTPALWTDLAPATLLAMGRFFIARPGLSPEVIAERQWNTGVFAGMIAGKQTKRSELLTQRPKPIPNTKRTYRDPRVNRSTLIPQSSSRPRRPLARELTSSAHAAACGPPRPKVSRPRQAPVRNTPRRRNFRHCGGSLASKTGAPGIP